MKHYDYIGKLSEGKRRVKMGTPPVNLKCGYIDEAGNEIIPLIYSGVRDFSEGLAAVRTGNWADGKWGFINAAGELVIDYRFQQPRNCMGGMIKAVVDGEWVYVDRKGSKTISLKAYELASRYRDGYAYVTKTRWPIKVDYTWGIIDENGNEVVPCKVHWGFRGSYNNNFKDDVKRYHAYLQNVKLNPAKDKK